MGANMVRRLVRHDHQCVVYDRSKQAVTDLVKDKAVGATSLADLVKSLQKPRAVWLMVPSAAVDKAIADLLPLLEAGDILIDGGNSYYVDDIRRAKELAPKKVHYVDVGTSGGVWGLERGYCMMIGGEPKIVKHLDPIFSTLAPGRGDEVPRTPGRETIGGMAEQGYLHCGPNGGGHFVKMVHNGIEYGLMAAYAEGFDILRGAASEERPEGLKFDLDLPAVCNELADRGKRVIVAGLDQDYLGKPFEPIPQLLAIAEYITKTLAICVVCGNPANHTQRLVASQDRVLLGAQGMYEARCRHCFDPALAQAPGAGAAAT